MNESCWCAVQFKIYVFTTYSFAFVRRRLFSSTHTLHYLFATMNYDEEEVEKKVVQKYDSRFRVFAANIFHFTFNAKSFCLRIQTIIVMIALCYC